METISFAYYILMLAIGLKLIHSFYSHFRKKKAREMEQTEEHSLSLFGSTDTKADSEEKKKDE